MHMFVFGEGGVCLFFSLKVLRLEPNHDRFLQPEPFKCNTHTMSAQKSAHNADYFSTHFLFCFK